MRKRKGRDPEDFAYMNSAKRLNRYVFDQNSSTMNQFDNDYQVVKDYMKYKKRKK